MALSISTCRFEFLDVACNIHNSTRTHAPYLIGVDGGGREEEEEGGGQKGILFALISRFNTMLRLGSLRLTLVHMVPRPPSLGNTPLVNMFLQPFPAHGQPANQPDRQTDRQTDGRTDGQAGRQAGCKEMGGPTAIHSHRP
ncbi:hypothetical protein LZ31DRAFT_537584 [Colletotrichum somersetense]|nr:hypothetical protein LZ31DRAFT_537584 [Colletotrichum somersetense]